MKPRAGVPGERRVLVEQELMCGQDGFKLARTVDVLAHFRKESHPEHCQRLVVFPGVPGTERERADRVAHPVAGFVGRSRILQKRPGDTEVLAMVKILVADFPALEALREFEIGEAVRGCRSVHRYYDIVISESSQIAATTRREG